MTGIGLISGTDTEWGVHYQDSYGQHISWIGDEEDARRDAGRKPSAGQRITLVRRQVTYGPAEVVSEGTWREPEGAATDGQR